jgi:hypothetical protein
LALGPPSFCERAYADMRRSCQQGKSEKNAEHSTAWTDQLALSPREPRETGI